VLKRLLLGLACLLALSPPLAAAEKPVIRLYVTVDWEGWSLDDENLEAMRAFRKKYPHIPMLHFLNPVYHLRPGADAAETTRSIQSTLLPGDTHGLHVHGWQSLIEACGLAFREKPDFSGAGQDCHVGECGYTVSLEYAYSQQELTKLIGCSAGLLERQGFNRPRSFRAGGWQQGPKLAQALRDNGFTADSSRTDARLIATRWGANSKLVNFINQLHPGSNPLDQPYELLPGLKEYPNNASLADYTSAHKLVEIFSELVRNGKTVMVLGFHQETAFSYLHRMEDAIPLMEKAAAEAGIKLEWVSRMD
jgi:hypothetical protein